MYVQPHIPFTASPDYPYVSDFHPAYESFKLAPERSFFWERCGSVEAYVGDPASWCRAREIHERFLVEQFAYLDAIEQEGDKTLLFEELSIAAYLAAAYIDMYLVGMMAHVVEEEDETDPLEPEEDSFEIVHPCQAFYKYLVDPTYLRPAAQAALWRIELDSDFRQKVYARELLFVMKRQEIFDEMRALRSCLYDAYRRSL